MTVSVQTETALRIRQLSALSDPSLAASGVAGTQRLLAMCTVGHAMKFIWLVPT
jgi:hypothetical protein